LEKEMKIEESGGPDPVGQLVGKFLAMKNISVPDNLDV
jgi:hypothetical protein